MFDTKQSIYDEITRLLSWYEEKCPDMDITMEDFYSLLVKIQNNWECVITAQDEGG